MFFLQLTFGDSVLPSDAFSISNVCAKKYRRYLVRKPFFLGSSELLSQKLVSAIGTNQKQAANVCPEFIHLEYVRFCGLIFTMHLISEAELDRISAGIFDDRESIVKHNPIGTPDEVLLWMLLSCLVSYLSIPEIDTPCFIGRPDARTYADAIRFVLRNRKNGSFDEGVYIDRLLSV
jgi:hypothetical protein